MNHCLKNKIKSYAIIFLIGILMIPAYGMEKDSPPPFPSGEVPASSIAPGSICPEGWAWRENFKITINGAEHAEITRQINDLHIEMARKEEWVYPQIKDTKGIIPAVNVAFSTIGILLKEGDHYRYKTILLIDPERKKEYVFLSGRAFSDDVKTSLASLEEKFLIYLS